MYLPVNNVVMGTQQELVFRPIDSTQFTCKVMHVFESAASAGLCSDPSLLVVSSPPLGSSAITPIEGEGWASVCCERKGVYKRVTDWKYVSSILHNVC